MSSTVAPSPPGARAAAPTGDLPGRARAPWIVLAVLGAAAAALLLYLTRGNTFYYDEWNFVDNRQAFTADVLLDPHNEHNVLVPVLVFKAGWALFGLGDYWAFRVLVIGLHAVCAGLLYLVARRRVGDRLALAPAAVLLLLGTAWEIFLWPFEIQFLIPVAAGLAALLAIERRDLRGDLAASGALAVAFASGSLAFPIALGVGVELLFGPERWKRVLRVLAPPVALYGLWLHLYDPFRHRFGSYASVPGFVVEQLGAALTAIAGFEYRSARLAGIALAVVLLAAIAHRLLRAPDRARLAAVSTMAAGYWGALALYRPWVRDAPPSRFLYAGAVFVLLALVELARHRRIDSRVLAAVGAAVVLAVVSGSDDLRGGARQIRLYSAFVAADLGALELARPTVEPGFRPEPTRAPDIEAGKYFAATARWGSPADTPQEILRRPEPARQAADLVLISALRLAARPALSAPPRGTAPAVVRTDSGTARTRGSCVAFTPGGAAGALELRVPAGGLLVTVEAGPFAQVSLRRFADGYVPPNRAPAEAQFANRQGFGRGLLRGRALRLAGGRSSILRIPVDRFSRPWHARVLSARPLVACAA